jgi:tRNA(Leu) C34 or U34 (ribose-2'-O)-methylase TrmL
MSTNVLLVDPKYPHNVGNALRAAALLGAQRLYWTGERVPAADEDWPEGARLPREERMRCYQRTRMVHVPDKFVFRPVDYITQVDIIGYSEKIVPVCVEIVPGTEDLLSFDHPEHALYIFGPEDREVPQGIRRVCHRFVRIPTAIPDDDPHSRTPYNLAAAVNIVLYDRLLKSGLRKQPYTSILGPSDWSGAHVVTTGDRDGNWTGKVT